MTQKQRALATLAGMIVIAGAIALFAWRSQKQDEEKKTSDDKTAQLFSFDPAAVSGLTVVAKGQTTVLSKASDGWRITKPIDARADDSTVESILSNVAGMKRKSVIEEHATDPHKFGLDNPSADVTVTFPGGTAEVAVGMTNEFSGGQYSKIGASDAVELIDGTHDAMLARTTFDLRDKHIVIFDETLAQKIDVSDAPDVYSLERNQKQWKVTAPQEEKADDGAVEKVLALALDLRVREIADERGADLAKFGLDHPKATLSISLGGDKHIDLKFGMAKKDGADHLYVQSSQSPLVAEVPSSADSPLHQSLEALADKTLAKVERSEIAAMQFETDKDEKILVQRKSEALPDGGTNDLWSELSPKSGPVKKWKMNSLEVLFSNLKGTKIVGSAPAELAKFGLEKPSLAATIQDASGKSLASVKFGKTDDGNGYAIAEGDTRILAVDKSKTSQLPKSGDELLDLPPDAGH